MTALRRIFTVMFTVLLAAFLCAAAAENGQDVFEVKRVGNIHPYADNSFRVRNSEAGNLEISIHDNICIYRTIEQAIEAGETVIHWDGCGYNREKLYEKTYTITAELRTDSGKILKLSFDSPVEYAAQCLQYALPSSDTLYLDHQDTWFIEYKTVTKGNVVTEIVSNDDPGETYTYNTAATGGKIARKDFASITGKKARPRGGEYTLSVYESSKPDEKYVYSLHIREASPDPEPISPTGEIMAERGMSDAEIWEMMMRPSVVVDIDSFRHQNVYDEPDPGSSVLGTLHGQSQGLKVIITEGNWAKVGAWNHEEAVYIEGWVPLDRLKVEKPRGEYGILIDKQKQTLTVYQNGRAMDTLLVSTGRAEKNSLYQETSAGCFLTGYHRVNFSMNGQKYDYVIQYDGGNLLHQTPYEWGQQKKDFTLGRGYLGAKASHACIRIQPEPGPGGLNAYWLFTHIPYHTRVMILDDPWEHESTALKLKRSDKSDISINNLHVTNTFGSRSGQKVEITFGGCVIPGGTRAFNSRKESLQAYADDKGYETLLNNLSEIFDSDDLTCVNLCGVIQKDEKVFPEDKGTVYAPAGAEKIFRDASVELVQMTSDRLHSSGGNFYDGTAEALKQYTDPLEKDQHMIYTLKGHLFGFTGCSESEYLKNPEIIDMRTGRLKEAGCEKIIMLISWSDGHENAHSIVQEAMAHRSVRAGADLVVGSCPGVVQGFDLIEGVPVIYSCGDLINGSTSNKPRNQQGMIFRVRFDFENEKESVSVTAVPILPYGSADTGKNEYCPSVSLSEAMTEKAVRNLWLDSTDAALEHLSVFLRDQS